MPVHSRPREVRNVWQWNILSRILEMARKA